MGIFSRKPKPARSSSKLVSDAQSDRDSVKSPMSRNNRSSGGTAGSIPTTPLTPFSPALPKVDMPKPPDPNLDPAAYLRSLGAVRERSKIVMDKALKGQLSHFNVDMNKFPDVVSFVCGIIKVSLLLLQGAMAHVPVTLEETYTPPSCNAHRQPTGWLARTPSTRTASQAPEPTYCR